ncbi:glycosyltransferase family 4 protein [Winogradskyella sp. PE311]|uniref:glycosyltransferase family 4 protein n=1 Tax=Winogradskyella sp. PE311 TaxID=3366943 RepID=UPI003980128C
MTHKKQKIAFVIGALKSGGAERVITNLSNELVKNFDVTIITFISSEPFYALDTDVNVVSCLNALNKPASVFDSIKLNYSIYKKVKYITKTNKIDLLIGFITSANIIATLAAKSNNIPSIISERNDPLKNDIPKFWLLLRKFIYPKADCLVAQTNKVKDIYNSMIKTKSITVLPNPIASKLSKLRIDYRNREKIILTVGTLNNDKRQEKIVLAFHKLELTDWKLLLIGDGPNKEKIKTLIQNNNLSDKVEILSQIKDVHNYYNKASIFAFASKAEGFPNVLLEAMTFGLPSLSTDCNYGPSELINDGENGFLVPVDNQEQFVEKLKMLTEDVNLRNSFSKKALLTTEKYIDTHVTSQWEALISKHLTK